MWARVCHGVGVWRSGQLCRASSLWVLGINLYPRNSVSLHTLLNKMSTFTVGKPCCVLSFTEPRLPSVRYRARCWVSGCTTIFSSFPSLLTGYCPHNIGLFFTPVPFWLSNVLRKPKHNMGRKHQKQFSIKATSIKEETERRKH